MREQAHNKRKHDLEEEIKRLDGRHKSIKDSNIKKETELNTAYESNEKMFQNALETYDADMTGQSEEKQAAMREYEEQHKELMQYKEEYTLRKKEREKRDEIARIM